MHSQLMFCHCYYLILGLEFKSKCDASHASDHIIQTNSSHSLWRQFDQGSYTLYAPSTDIEFDFFAQVFANVLKNEFRIEKLLFLYISRYFTLKNSSNGS